MEILDNGSYGKIKSSKDVIFDNSIDYTRRVKDEEPYEREFMNPDTYIPFAMRMDVPEKYRGPNAIFPVQIDKNVTHKPTRTHNNSLAQRNIIRNNEIINKIFKGTLPYNEKQINSNDSGEISQNQNLK